MAQKQNLATLKAAVAAFHEKEVADLKKGPVDLFLVAANNARKEAEKGHTFEFAKLRATLVIDSVNGGALTDAVILPANTFSEIRSISAVGLTSTSGRIVPAAFSSLDSAIEVDRSALALSDDGLHMNRYPSDADVEEFAGAGHIGVVQRGGYLYKYPLVSGISGNQTIHIEGSGWLNDYTDEQVADEDAEPQDFFLRHGFEWLMWTAIITLNYKFQTFVPRQEGNVGSPTKLQDKAWRDLLIWDAYSVDPATTTSR